MNQRAAGMTPEANVPRPMEEQMPIRIVGREGEIVARVVSRRTQIGE